ncbi:MAG: 50S ribosomal protein L11 [Nitrospiraceae bacterium]|nr:50S ribosomal protein L11 [Nitrospiraceae bacterium]
MAKTTVRVLIEGGKATAAPPLGPALGPLGVNIGQVVSEINNKTKEFKGMQVPAIVTVDTTTKQFTVEIGTPPSSELIKKEAGIQKGSSDQINDKVADLKIQQIVKVAKMKESALLGKDIVSRVKEILGTCQSMGVLVEGKDAHKVIEEINEGKYVDTIKSGKTELTKEELEKLEKEKDELQAKIEKEHEEMMKRANAIIKEMEGKTPAEIRKRLKEEKIDGTIISELLPEEDKKKK